MGWGGGEARGGRSWREGGAGGWEGGKGGILVPQG